MTSQPSLGKHIAQIPKMCKKYFGVIHPQAIFSLKCTVGKVNIIFILFLLGLLLIFFHAFFIVPFMPYRSNPVRDMVESEAQLALKAVSQYFIDQGQNKIPSLAELVKVVDYTPNKKVDIQINGTIKRFTVQATDKSHGYIYILTWPSYQGHGYRIPHKN
jgi:hypothetical protein